VAYGLSKDAAYFAGLAGEMQAKRDRLSAGLTGIGLSVLPCGGTYFVNIDLSGSPWDGQDVAFCKHMTETAGVTAIPVSAFYQQDALTNVVRFCFSKQDDILDEAVSRLRAHLT
jgi:aspartate/methionine/tyrosine aminotransferase